MPPGEITQLLISLREGRREALNELLPLVYEHLRAMARRKLSFRGTDQTLDTTALVHEAYLKLLDQSRLTLNDRRHFFSVAALAMRQIVVDHARRRRARKRGGGLQRVDLDQAQLGIERQTDEILSLDEALTRLSLVDGRLARVVELRFFAGLSVEETAEVLDLNARTVKRDWRKARALLYRSLHGRDPE